MSLGALCVNAMLPVLDEDTPMQVARKFNTRPAPAIM